jgi:hypothetical protein
VFGGRHGERTDRRDVFAIEDGFPIEPAVLTFPDAAVGAADVDDRRVARLADDRGHSVADGTDGSKVKSPEWVGLRLTLRPNAEGPHSRSQARDHQRSRHGDKLRRHCCLRASEWIYADTQGRFETARAYTHLLESLLAG